MTTENDQEGTTEITPAAEAAAPPSAPPPKKGKTKSKHPAETGPQVAAGKPPRPKRSYAEAMKDYVFFDPGKIGGIKVTMEVPLGSDLGHNAIETYLEKIEEIVPKLYDFVENRLKYGQRHARSRELGNMIDKRMERSFAMLDYQAKVRNMEERLTKAGIDFAPLFEQRVATVSFSTPHARRFIEGVQLQDRLVTLYQLAWVAGLVDTSEQRETFFKSTATVGAAFNRVNGMMKAVNRGINPLVESGRRDGKTLEEVRAQGDSKGSDAGPAATTQEAEAATAVAA